MAIARMILSKPSVLYVFLHNMHNIGLDKTISAIYSI